MRKLNLYSAIFWLFFAIYISIESYNLGLGDWHKPGPGYFPFGSALLLGIISILIILKAIREAHLERNQVVSLENLNLKNVVLVLVAMVAYVLFLKSVGFILCTFLLVAFFQRAIAFKRWSTILIVSSLVSIGFYVVFNVLLNAQIPRGILGF